MESPGRLLVHSLPEEKAGREKENNLQGKVETMYRVIFHQKSSVLIFVRVLFQIPEVDIRNIYSVLYWILGQ